MNKDRLQISVQASRRYFMKRKRKIIKKWRYLQKTFKKSSLVSLKNLNQRTAGIISF